MICCISALNAQASAMREISVGAEIIEGISLSQTTTLNFGSNAIRSNEKGTVTLASNSNARNYTGGLTSGGPTNKNATNATFEINGASLATYAITLPATITLTHTSIADGVNTMVITSMKARIKDEESDAVTGTINADGTDLLTLGATLNVQENQIKGQYSGQYEICINYN